MDILYAFLLNNRCWTNTHTHEHSHFKCSLSGETLRTTFNFTSKFYKFTLDHINSKPRNISNPKLNMHFSAFAYTLYVFIYIYLMQKHFQLSHEQKCENLP